MKTEVVFENTEYIFSLSSITTFGQIRYSSPK